MQNDNRNILELAIGKRVLAGGIYGAEKERRSISISAATIFNASENKDIHTEPGLDKLHG